MEEKPRGELKEFEMQGEQPEHEENVELAGALWTVDYTPITLRQYIKVAPGNVNPAERKLAVAEACKVHLNDQPVDWDALPPLLGLELMRYIDEKLSEPPSKN